MNPKAIETSRSVTGAAETVAFLLRDLIDYAGLFPPASLAMAPAVANYETYSRSEHAWVLGRFILPVARLGEFKTAFEETSSRWPTAEPESLWVLSVLPGADVAADLVRIREFNAQAAVSHSATKVVIRSVEVKIASPEEIARLSKIIPSEFETYFEIPLCGNERDCVEAAGDCGHRAKIRTGGETADRFPAPENVVEFIHLCAAANVPFKATAGLHHPLRSLHRFTYQPESPSGIMHGFLNVFLAAAFVRAGMEASLALQLLKEQSAQAFHFDSDGVLWRDHRLDVREIANARQRFSISFGSCSFTEPINDLRSLHLL